MHVGMALWCTYDAATILLVLSLSINPIAGISPSLPFPGQPVLSSKRLSQRSGTSSVEPFYRKSLSAVSSLHLLERIARGGSLIQSSEDEATYLVKKLRNVIRSTMEIGERNCPMATDIFRQILLKLESLTNVVLLPATKSENATSTRDGTTRRSKNKSRLKKSTSNASKIETKAKSSVCIQAKPERTIASNGSKEGNKSGVGKHHLAKELKASNPNHRIQRELKEFLAAPPPNLRVSVGKNLRVWIITMTGAQGTIYDGEKYRLRVAFPDRYPIVPPSVYFLKPTPRHEHVYTNGDICLSLLGKDWRPTMTAQSIAVSILSILSSAKNKALPMDNSRVASMKPGQPQDNWVYHDDNC